MSAQERKELSVKVERRKTLPQMRARTLGEQEMWAQQEHWTGMGTCAEGEVRLGGWLGRQCAGRMVCGEDGEQGG